MMTIGFAPEKPRGKKTKPSKKATAHDAAPEAVPEPAHDAAPEAVPEPAHDAGGEEAE